jgi:solute carrier family 25 phosphate transporter 23/24/25/41
MSLMVNESTITSTTNDNSHYGGNAEGDKEIPESTQFYISETPSERDIRIKELFNTLDRENKGLLDSKAIQHGFTIMTHLPARTKYANELLSKCDTSNDGLVDYEEFKTYVNDKEDELWKLFKKLDRSGEGQLDPTDLQIALKRTGIEISENDVVNFMQLMDLGKLCKSVSFQ